MSETGQRDEQHESDEEQRQLGVIHVRGKAYCVGAGGPCCEDVSEWVKTSLDRWGRQGRGDKDEGIEEEVADDEDELAGMDKIAGETEGLDVRAEVARLKKVGFGFIWKTRGWMK
jgi:hypothetical protein